MRWRELPVALLLLTMSAGVESASYSNSTAALSTTQNTTAANSILATSMSGRMFTSSATTTSSGGLGSYILAGLNGISSRLSGSTASSSSALPPTVVHSASNLSESLSMSFSGAESTTAALLISATSSTGNLSQSQGVAIGTGTVNPVIHTANNATAASLLLPANATIAPHASNATSASSEFGYANVTIAATGSGYAYASSCNQLLLSWSAESLALETSYTISSSTTLTDVESGLQASTTVGPITPTVCNGVPMVLGGMLDVLATSEAMSTWTYIDSEYITATDNFSVPRPDCTINEKDCKSLYTTWSNVQETSLMSPPACDFETLIASCTECCQSCTIAANGVQMMYWPPTATGDYCAGNRTYMTGLPTRPGFPNTKVLSNTTYTSPTV